MLNSRDFEYFIDNFRGFKTTFISLGKVNFFVGENSSGKSSLIEVINVLANEHFWYHLRPSAISSVFQRYNNFAEKKNIEGYPKLRLGFVCKNRVNEGFHAVVVEFEEKDNSPRLSKILSARSDELVSFDLSKKVVQISSLDENDIIRERITRWCAEGGLPDARLTSEVKFKFPRFGPVLLNIHQMKVVDDTGRLSFPARDDMPMPSFTNTFLHAPLRAKPKDFYEYKDELTYTEDGEHSPLLLLREPKHSEEIVEHLNKFGSDSGLYESISVKKLGPDDDSPVKIVVGIEQAKRKMTQVGYGVSQIFPILTEIIYQSLVLEIDALFLIQQPEVHLHPRAQATFGEFIFDVCHNNERSGFVIETHSDYVIDRFKINVRDHGLNGEAKTFFFYREGELNKVDEMIIGENGDYINDLPERYQRFFLLEQKKVIGI